ncbi:MAG: hypothetical protein DME27_05250 [Verrucomicrobia bacterium]|nr:MAG: hypothetical protein DME27_05250 [Verrucomicrobiota bacterium]
MSPESIRRHLFLTLFGLRRQSEATTALFPTRCDSPVGQVIRDACEPEESGVALRFPPHSKRFIA